MAGALYCFSACLQALRSALNVSQQAVPVLKDGVLVGGEILDVTVDPLDLAGGLQPGALGSGVAGVGVTQGALLGGARAVWPSAEQMKSIMALAFSGLGPFRSMSWM